MSALRLLHAHAGTAARAAARSRSSLLASAPLRISNCCDAVAASSAARPFDAAAAASAFATPRRFTHSSAPLQFAAPSSAAPTSKEGDPSKLALTLANVTKRFQGGRALFQNLNLSFYHGAKIGILGANGCGKSSFLKIVGGVDTDIEGLAKAFPGFRIGYLAQEPELDNSKTVSENIADGIGYRQDLLTRFEAISVAFGEEGADFDQLTEEQAEVQAEIEKLNCWDLQYKVDTAMAALNCPPGDSPVENLSGVRHS